VISNINHNCRKKFGPGNLGKQMVCCLKSLTTISFQSKIAFWLRFRFIPNEKSNSDDDFESFPTHSQSKIAFWLRFWLIPNAKSHSETDFDSFPTHPQSKIAFWDRFQFMPNPKSHSKTCFPCQNTEKSWIALPNPTILTISPIFRFWVDFQNWINLFPFVEI
jgi:hypothetical protein